MSFDLREVSRWFGRPVHLFRFACGPLVWHFAHADRDVPLGDVTWKAANISRSALRDSVEYAKNNVTLTMDCLLDPSAIDTPPTQSLGRLWRPYPPSAPVFVTCLAMHRGDDAPAVEWHGRVIAPKYTDAQLELVCEPSHRSERRTGLQLRWQRACPLAQYGQGVGMCNLDPAAWGVAAVLEQVQGLKLVAAGFAESAETLAGGYVEWTREDGLLERRSIMSHDGSTITIQYGGHGLEPELEMTAYPGCAHTFAACKSFGNSDNFGGSPDLPAKNPMGGNPVW
ncbi:phage BR0599 family protein [Stenotrophomonas sp. PS02298]|uniref:phage BR0599 family protein n=1 Tax=Stenotrophomonas sp. PS02298 TaxID=2991424 RepID=UPI00249B2703|nr:phage BR0599 family protein [Stenotrophomonas sp. PS02298]